MKRNSGRRFLQVVLLLAVLFPLFGSAVPAFSAAKLNKKKLTLCVGEKAALKVTGAKGKITWSTSAKKVAVVKNGKVTAKKAGKAVITAKAGSKKLKCTVTVKPTYKFNQKQVTEVSLKLKKGQKKKVVISFSLDDVDIWYKSSNNSIVSGIWGKGWKGDDTYFTLVGENYGDAVITIYNKFNKDKLKIKVHVPSPAENVKFEIPESVGDNIYPENRFEVLSTEIYGYSETMHWFSLRVGVKISAVGTDRSYWHGYLDLYDGSGKYLGEDWLSIAYPVLGKTYYTNVQYISDNVKKIVFRENPLPEQPEPQEEESKQQEEESRQQEEESRQQEEESRQQEKETQQAAGWTTAEANKIDDYLDKARQTMDSAEKITIAKYGEYLHARSVLNGMKTANGYLQLAYETAVKYEETWSDGSTLEESIQKAMDYYGEVADIELTRENESTHSTNITMAAAHFEYEISVLKARVSKLKLAILEKKKEALLRM